MNLLTNQARGDQMTATRITLEGNQRRTTYTSGTSRKVAGSIPDGVIGVFQ
jgi:hypothetical protein